MKNRSLATKLIVFISIVVVLLAADLIIKQVVFTNLAGKPDVVVIPGFWSFHFIGNPDSGFSLFHNLGLDAFMSPTLRTAIIVGFQFLGVAVAVYFFWSPKNYLHSWVKRLPLAFIAAGGLGNAIDRLIHGFVVDFVLWYVKGFTWPIFNLADSMTVVGVFVLAAFLLFTKEAKKPVITPTDAGKDEPPKV